MASLSGIRGKTVFVLVFVLSLLGIVSDAEASSVSCWNASIAGYLDAGTYDAAMGIYPQVAKFCKCAMGTYDHRQYLNTSTPADCSYYADPDDNENWGAGLNYCPAAVYRVQCSDGVYYNTSGYYAYGSSDTSSIHRVSVDRDLPSASTVFAGGTYLIALNFTVNESDKPNAVGITEYFPSGWEVSNISHGGMSGGDRIEWLLWSFGNPVQDTYITYRIGIPGGAFGTYVFSGFADVGDYVYNISGDTVLSVAAASSTSTTSTVDLTSTTSSTSTTTSVVATATTTTSVITTTSVVSSTSTSTSTSSSTSTTRHKSSSSDGSGDDIPRTTVTASAVLTTAAPAVMTAAAASTAPTSPAATTTSAPIVTTTTPGITSTTESAYVPETTVPATASSPAETASAQAPSGKTHTEGLQSMSASSISSDAGGPYIAAAGSEVVFDASKSTGAIASYAWSFGDGATGSGKTTKHAYAKEGSYRVTLTVIDDQGRADVSYSGVYVKILSVYLDLAVDPQKERYDYGDVIAGIDVNVSYSDGSTAQGASVSGTLSGKERTPLVFKETGSGRYHADVNYPIVKGESEFINITVEAKDPFGRTGRMVKKLILLPKETEMMLNVHKPARMLFAYGQKVDFEVRFLKEDTLEVMQRGDVVLYEGWSERGFAFRREGDDYLLTYEIPKDARDPVSFIIYGNGFAGEKNYQAAKEVNFDLSHDLAMEIVSPIQGAYASDVKEVKVKVYYPDGSIVPDERLNAVIGAEPLVLERSGDLFAAGYYPAGNESETDVWVFDGIGNGGGAKIRFSIPETIADYSGMIYSVLSLSAALLVLFLAYRFIVGQRRNRSSLMKEYEESRRKIDSLKAVTSNVMHEYYTRKITEEEARKRVLDCEKELVIERRKLRSLAEKLGITPVKEDEDPKLKKQLEEMGLGPSAADEARK